VPLVGDVKRAVAYSLLAGAATVIVAAGAAAAAGAGAVALVVRIDAWPPLATTRNAGAVADAVGGAAAGATLLGAAEEITAVLAGAVSPTILSVVAAGVAGMLIMAVGGSARLLPAVVCSVGAAGEAPTTRLSVYPACCTGYVCGTLELGAASRLFEL
jgi:hypothetical protein